MCLPLDKTALTLKTVTAVSTQLWTLSHQYFQHLLWCWPQTWRRDLSATLQHLPWSIAWSIHTHLCHIINSGSSSCRILSDFFPGETDRGRLVGQITYLPVQMAPVPQLNIISFSTTFLDSPFSLLFPLLLSSHINRVIQILTTERSELLVTMS